VWTRKNVLPQAIAGLEKALAAQWDHEPQVWTARVDQALFAIEQAIWRHDATLESDEGHLTEVDSAQSPSPGLDRRVGRLHDGLADVGREVGVLRQSVRQVLNAGGEQGLSDGLRDRIFELLHALRECSNEEANLVLETTTTDIGAGD